MMTNPEAVERAACAVVDHWRRHRIHRPDLVSATDPAFTKALDALDALLVGNALRCCCLSKGKGGHHDVRCPANRPAAKLAATEGEVLALRAPASSATPGLERLALGLRARVSQPRAMPARFAVRGQTYAHKETLKKLGAGWEEVLRTWMLVDPTPAVRKRVEKLGLSLEEI